MKHPLAALAAALLLGPLAHAQPPGLDDRLEKHTFTKDSASLPYRLLKPLGYDPGSKGSYPLVIFLHGMGERGSDNTKQLKHGIDSFAREATRKKYRFFLVAPQCPGNRTWCSFGRRGTKESPTLAKEPTEPAALVLELIDSLAREHRIDRSRIYLTGLSMGGYGTWDLIARKPGLFAAAVPVCGGGDPAQAKKLTRVPIWCFHGDKDTAVPVARSRDMIDAVKKAGGKPLYTEYKGVAHDSWTRTYKDDKVLAWLFKQKKEK
jgi:predicted peptidase